MTDKRKFLSRTTEAQVMQIAGGSGYAVSPVRSATSKELELSRRDNPEVYVYISRVSGVKAEKLHITVSPDVWEAKGEALMRIPGVELARTGSKAPWHYSSNYKGFRNKEDREHYGRKLLVPYPQLDALWEVLAVVAR